MGKRALALAGGLLGLAVLLRPSPAPTQPNAPVCSEIHEACIPIHPHGFGAGGTLSRGCLDWSQSAACIYLDYNCNSVQELPNSDGVTECCIPCAGATTTTSTSIPATTSTSTSTTTTTVSSTTSSTGVSSTTSTTSTTSTSTSTTSTTVPQDAFAVGNCFTLIGARPEHDALHYWIAPATQMITAIGCHCEGQCTAPRATISVTNSAGGEITTLSPVVCDGGDTATIYQTTDPADPDRTILEGDRLLFAVTNTPATYDRITVCVRFDPF